MAEEEEEKKGEAKETKGSFALGLADLASYLVPGGFVTTTTAIALIYESGHDIQWALSIATVRKILPRADVLLATGFGFLFIAYLFGHLCAVLAAVVCERIFVCNVRGYPYLTLLFHSSKHQASDDDRFRRRYYRTMVTLFFLWLLLVLRQFVRAEDVAICWPAWKALCFQDATGAVLNCTFWVMVLLLVSALCRGLLKLADDAAPKASWLNWGKRIRHSFLFLLACKVLRVVPRSISIVVSFFMFPIETLFLDKFLGLNEALGDEEQRIVLENVARASGTTADKLHPSTSLFWIPYLKVTREGSAVARFLERQNLNGVLIRNLCPALIIGSFQLVPMAQDLATTVGSHSVFSILSLAQLPYVVFGLGLVCVVRYYHLMYQRFTRPLFRYFAIAGL